MYMSKRKKMIVGMAALAVAASFSFSVNEILSSRNSESSLISYSPLAPSTIAKNRPNESGFNSPVTNAKLDPKTEPKKIEKTTPPQIVAPKIEEKPVVPEKPKEIKPKEIKKEENKPSAKVESVITIPARPAETARPITNPSRSQPSQSNRTSAEVSQGQIDAAKSAWKIGIGSSISKTQSKIKGYEDRIAELNRRMKHDYNLYSYGGKVSKEVFEESIKAQIWEANNWKQRETDYLNVLKEQEKRGPQFTELDLKSIARGMLPSKDDHNVWTFVNPDDNPVTGKNGTYRKRNENRVLNIPGWAPRTPSGIANQEFEGWTKNDVSTSNSEFKSAIEKALGSGANTGSIKVYEYTPNDSNPNKSSKSKITAVSLDARDNNAFQKFQDFLKATSGKIDAVVLKNVGSGNKEQNITKILENLPEKVQKLTLFLDNKKAINGLRAIQNKKLKELELYSNDMAVDENWSINPNAIANVDYISFDYNNAATFHKNNPGEQIPGSILFDTLRWDSGDDVNKITDGLKIAFGSKIYQRPFQGRQGGKGGYPPNLDFSDTNIKTLKDIKFDEVDKLFNDNIKNWKEDKYAAEDYEGFKQLKFNYVYFSVDKNNNGSGGSSSTYTAQASDFDNSQFSTRLTGIEPVIKPPERDMRPKPTIYLRSNGENKYGVTFNLKGQWSNFTEDAKKQLKVFVEAAHRGGTFSKIVVDSDDVKTNLIKYYNEEKKKENPKFVEDQTKFAGTIVEINSTQQSSK
ncbi:putative immunoglobulin-blocking virulence protein [Mycoplasma sp. 'Moose RK']|uniref:putative immunoglobulin-blocking virulence protein n=1 Tax=Mycoplasma sp. 'Moose RK' TaxID=2780095 RepID=UPI0018C3423A|nr:putative immunoglobulin-blocking virulence protein [Mycoplasma sp. 'Moose RK']MBG0730885.1 putative immunoglobulin-blocking virulence protein [Mycoplasma sp. 'Moose RK']